MASIEETIEFVLHGNYETFTRRNEILCNRCNLHLSNEDTQQLECNQCHEHYHLHCSYISTNKFNRMQESEFLCHTCVPEDIKHIKWGNLSGLELFETVDDHYYEVMGWKRNVFKLPSGKVGKSLLDEMNYLITRFNNDDRLSPICIKLLMIIGPLLLQKPSKRSKTKDHVRYLEKRLNLWKMGDIFTLMKECRAIQQRLVKSKQRHEQIEKVFTRLMLKGNVSGALKWISSCNTSILMSDEKVIEELKSKHPCAIDASEEVLYGVEQAIPEEVIFEDIDGRSIYNSAKLTRGAAGPSGIDAEGWRRFLCSKSFGASSGNLCTSIAEMARKIATKQIPSHHLTAYTASRLVPLDKKPGVRPIGIGEVLRRIIGKAIAINFKADIMESTAPLQTCGGIKGGVEAAVHGLREIYEDSNTQCILLVDAENAFNQLNRKAGLHNVGIVCPFIAQYLKNTYKKPSDLFISGSKNVILKSKEGTTQGDNLAMAFYACALMKLVKDLRGHSPDAKSIWYADDSACGGSVEAVFQWWSELQQSGPKYGYFPKVNKTWLIVKPEYQTEARQKFIDINITIEGCRYLGSFIGNDDSKENFIKSSVMKWQKDINALSEIAKTEPQLAYSAYVYGVQRRWNFLTRTTPRISHLLGEIEECIQHVLLPAICGRQISDEDRKIMSLPVRLGGMAIENPGVNAESEYQNSKKVTEQIWRAIVNQNLEYKLNEDEMKMTITHLKKEKNERIKELFSQICENVDEKKKRQLILLNEKGTSSWLTSLPLEEHNFILNKQEFQDGIALRYGLYITDIPKQCICGKENSADHSLICKKGGFVSMRHNSIRDTTAELLGNICKDVVTEPHLMPLSGEHLNPGTNVSDDARLDISARGVWSALDKAFFDVRIIHPNAASNADKPIATMYATHEQEKKRKYNERVLQVEKSTFTPLVFTTTGGMGQECKRLFKRIAQLMAQKHHQNYSDVISWIRKRLSFDLLRTCVIAVRGFRGKPVKEGTLQFSEIDFNLVDQ